MKTLKELTNKEIVELKNTTDGTIFWGGCVVYLGEDFTAYDYLVSLDELERQSNIDTATGQSLRNLAALCGVYAEDAKLTDEELRLAITKVNSSQVL